MPVPLKGISVYTREYPKIRISTEGDRGNSFLCSHQFDVNHEL